MNQSEKKLCEWQLQMTGDFFTLLINAMMRADISNQAKLMLAYPELMGTIIRYKNESGYYQKLCEEWNTEHPNHEIS